MKKSASSSSTRAGVTYLRCCRTREPGCEHLADGNGLAVQVSAIAANRFDGMADGMAEIENGAQSAFLFILCHHFGFDFTTTRHHCSQRLGIVLEQPGHFLFQSIEQ